MTQNAAPDLADTAPRYTSYPTAPHFHSGVTATTVGGWMRNVGPDEPLSLYLHIPFCDKLCWFCACHTRHTLRYGPVAAYLARLHREIGIVSGGLRQQGKVRAIHLGGGSPTMLKPQDLLDLMARLRSDLDVEPGVQLSIEIDPSDMDESRLDAVAAAGTTRASLGVQDFDPRVQDAINRRQGYALTRSVVEGLRARGIGSINLDLVYGLPHQTTIGVVDTMEQCLALRPERIALFGYAHVPWFKKHQKLIDEASLPDRAARLEQSQAAAERILAAGYVSVGLDHFALPGDGLARAARLGRLRRNFQGYTDDDCETLIGLGPSSISRFREGYAQNHPAMAQYGEAVAKGFLPVARGIALDAEDRARAWVIEQLMCAFAFDAKEMMARHGRAAAPIAIEAARLQALATPLLVRRGDRCEVPDHLRPQIRAIAARFDAYLWKGAARHSAAV